MSIKKIKLNESEKKTIILILAFISLERGILKHYRIKKLGRMKKMLKKKWKKVLPLISEDLLVIEDSKDPGELKHVTDRLFLYSRLYTDLINGYSMEKCSKCIQTLRDNKIIPSLKENFEFKILRLVSPRIKSRDRSADRPLKFTKLKEFPHLNEEVRKRLIRQFKKRLREKEPLLLMDQGFQLRIENFIRLHVDRIIDVCLEHGYKAIQYGYIPHTTERLSDYVEKKGINSIEWTIESGLLIDEIVRSLS